MNNKKYGLLGGGILVLALVAAVGIVYAAYTQSLTINGTANVKANSWDVHFTDFSEVKITGDAQEITAPTVKNNSTAIGDFSILLSKPGDSVEYTFDIVNTGTFDAIWGLFNSWGDGFSEIGDINVNTPECTGTGENAEEDATNVCNHLMYYVTFESFDNQNESWIEGWGYAGSGGAIEDSPVYDAYAIWRPMSKEAVLLKPNEKISDKIGRAKLVLQYRKDVLANELPKNDVAISGLDMSMEFTQA